MLISGRAKLVEEENGQRHKVKTLDKNEIDTMFVDNRAKSSNGKTLVICSEGLLIYQIWFYCFLTKFFSLQAMLDSMKLA